MVTQVSRPFIYGRFVWPSKGKKARTSGITLPKAPEFLHPMLDTDRIAIEVLREFSATEFVGKLYLLGGSPISYAPADFATVKQQDWYDWYAKVPKETKEQRKGFYFDVEGSGPWTVLFLRNESDDSGPYVAIGLKYK